MKIDYSVALVVLSLALATALPYTKESGVINLNKDNFANTVFSNEHVWIVEFYAPWCGHCKNLAPEYEKLAKDMKGIIKVAAINCDEDKELAGYFGVKGFPTIKIFPSNPVPTKDGKGFEKKPEDYNGPRTAAGMANAALSKLASFVKTVKSASDVDATSDLAKVILFTDKDKTTNLYKGLSVEFHNQLEFLEIRKSQKELVERFEITKFPTLLVLKTSGDSEVFSGKLAFDSIYKFLKPFAKKIQSQSSSTSSGESEKAAAAAPVEFEYDVRDEVNDQTTFDKICAAGKTCIIAFLDPTNSEADEQKRYLDLLEAVSEKHKKVVNFLWMDALKQTEFVDEFRLHSGFPSAILFNHKKNIMAPYFGSFSEEPLSEYAESITSGGIRRASTITKMPKVLSGAARKDEL